MSENRPLIGVIGSGSETYPAFSVLLGRWLAEKGCDLINGGGRGVMSSVAQAFAEISSRKGRVIGVIPAAGPCDTQEGRSIYSPPEGYPNPWVDVPIYTHLHFSGDYGKETASRNHIIILSADRIVAFPGGAGTRSEIQLALEYKKPLIIFNPNGEWDELKSTPTLIVKDMENVFQWLESNIPAKE
jgi:uncharacterized protein (TIGR00725 family)